MQSARENTLVMAKIEQAFLCQKDDWNSIEIFYQTGIFGQSFGPIQFAKYYSKAMQPVDY